MEYIYADKIGDGPEHPNKKWGLFTNELTVEQARARYCLDVDQRSKWFGIVRLLTGEQRPSAFVEMTPRANGVSLKKLNRYGTVEAAYSWRAYRASEDRPPENDPDKVFLGQIVWYAYPDEEKFFDRPESLGSVCMTFRPDGYAKEKRTTKTGFGQPDNVELREFKGVDVSPNWTTIPEFGDWTAFFEPDESVE